MALEFDNSYDFSRGVRVNKIEVEKMRNEIVKRIDAGSKFEAMAMGNTIVIGRKTSEGAIIIVADSYTRYEYKSNC